MRFPMILLSVFVMTTPNDASASQPEALAKTPYGPQAGPLAVETMLLDWRDEARRRDVPAKLYLPKGTEKPAPVIIFSHGLGGSRLGYEYLGQHWASYGYASVHLQHKGSDNEVWQGQSQPMEAMRKSLLDPQHALNRPADVAFALDQLEKLNDDAGTLRHRLDLKRAGVAGHSFGAFTTLAVAGQTFKGPLGSEFSAADPRIKAAVALSPSPPRGKADFDKAYGSVTMPVLHMTGTLDDSPVSDTKAADRLLPFKHSKGQRYLVVFEGGDHMVFSGRRRIGGALAGGQQAEKDAQFQSIVCVVTTAFWDAWLRDDADAKRFLADGQFEKLLGKQGTFEKRLTP
jgi:predicted dienelactone hydrolase